MSAQRCAVSFAASREPGSTNGTIAASGATRTPSSVAAAALPTSFFASTETVGSPRVPRTRIGVRSVSGLKSFGETTARRSIASVLSDTEPSTKIVESVVFTHEHLGLGDAAGDVEIDHVAQERQRLVARQLEAERLGDVEAQHLDDEVRDRARRARGRECRR